MRVPRSGGKIQQRSSLEQARQDWDGNELQPECKLLLVGNNCAKKNFHSHQNFGTAKGWLVSLQFLPPNAEILQLLLNQVQWE